MLFRFAWVFIFPEALQRHLHSAPKKQRHVSRKELTSRDFNLRSILTSTDFR